VTRRLLNFLRDEDGETATPGNGYTHVAHVGLIFTSVPSWRSLYQHQYPETPELTKAIFCNLHFHHQGHISVTQSIAAHESGVAYWARRR
jgi:hypothetical protein